MLQPRSTALLIACCYLLANCIAEEQHINSSPRRRRQDAKDVTTVLLVDSHGRSTFGRFLSVKPDLGLLTSTARTFIQEGVTTEYATQVLGTTLDNGRLYAHLLTKSSRVLYDNDAPTRSHLESSKKWNIDNNLIGKINFVKNTDYIAPNQVDNPFVVFPTSKPEGYEFSEHKIEANSDEELLQEPSNNPRVPFDESKKESRTFSVSSQNNVKVFQINPQQRHIDLQGLKVNSEENDVIRKDELNPSKVREWDNLPTFTVRNEFSPSGFSFLGDLPNFDQQTERSKATTAAERRAKLLFRGGVPNKVDLKTVTYTGFADFTTTVGDTVIVFTPQTSTTPIESKPSIAQTTKTRSQQTLFPAFSLKEPAIATKVKTFLNHEPGVVTETVEGHKLTMQTTLPTMVIDAKNRKPKQEVFKDEHEDVEAKSSVLAHEQQMQTPDLEMIKTTSGSTIIFAPDTIEPSESQIPMLSTPSDEDIAKIFASLQARAAQQSTEPLNTPSTIFYDEPTTQQSSFGGATTIFFEDDLPIQNTALPETTTFKQIEEESTTAKESEEILEKQTTEHIFTTTLKDDPITNEIITTSERDITTENLPETTTSEEEEFEEETDVQCTGEHKILPSTIYKTLTYLTTFFIPNGDETSTSIRSNEIVSTQISLETVPCKIDASATETTTQASVMTTTEDRSEEDTTQPQLFETTQPNVFETTTDLEPTTEQFTTTEQESTEHMETTPSEITTERRHVTESEAETTEMTTENGEEVELLFKTLYTTYTYLTTYFQESTSSIASRKVVITNVITSTLDQAIDATDDAVAGLVTNDFKTKPVTFDDFVDIAPSGVGIGRPTALPENNIENIGDNILDLSKATPALSDKDIQQTVNAIKTYYTTYTYFTTIFVDGETEISSRTEVYTNYVTPTITPTAVVDHITPTATEDLDEETVKSKIMALNIAPLNNYNSTIKRQKYEPVSDNFDNNIVASTTKTTSKYSTLDRTTTESSENDLLDLSEYETISTMVTDVRSSTSEGDRRIIDSVDKRNVLLDDQIVSESNNDSEIIPSPTLLLQTSYTTFTYFTTMYQGTTSSNIVSRLETITNVVTETITPTHTLSVEDLSLPITYFTTFTYWTTLYKDGTTKVTSREETVSNIVTPTPVATVIPETIKIEPTLTTESIPVTVNVEPTKPIDDDDLTTYYTTYTYYTTSYVGNSTILNSRLDTVTNVLNKTLDIDSNAIARAIGQGGNNNLNDELKTKSLPKEEAIIKPTGLLSTIKSTVENDGTQTVLSTDVYGTYIDGLYAKVLESTSIILTPTIAPSVVQEKLKPTGVVSINEGKILDADGISTLFYTTKAVGTYIDNLYAQVIESTSSLKIDDEKKALQTEAPPTHRTGLVRLIEGSIIHNQTTTLYQSKVLGTVIDGRYAQIIESTSSFIVDKVKPSASEINPTATQAPGSISSTAVPITPSPVVIEGSISDSAKLDDENTTEDDEENSTEDSDGNSRVKSRLTFQSRKRTFTPVIRPFASRSKPTFAPKRKGTKQSSATTITRSDFTPTVTAIPATKTGSRFGGGRKSSSLASPASPSSSGRRFSRPRSSSAAPSAGFSSTFSPNRRTSSRIQPTATGFATSSRRGSFRSSSQTQASIRPTASFNPNNRFRVRPSLPPTRIANAVTLPSTVSDDENDITTQITENPSNGIEENDSTAPTTTVEATSRRNQNPLLRFRRPISRPPPTAARTTPKPVVTRAGNRSGNRLTSTTSKPTRSTYRPAAQNRARPPNALFPRRNLFTTTSTTPEPDELEEEDNAELIDDAELQEGEEDDTEFEGSNRNTQTEKAPVDQAKKSARFGQVQIKPFLRKRAKRQATTYSRFRRPISRTTTAPPELIEEEPEPTKVTPRNRYLPRTRSRTDSYTTTPAHIKPTKPTIGSRSQFTLRDTSSQSRSNFRRPTTAASTYRRPTSRPSSSRSRTQNDNNSYNNNNRKTTRSRTTSRRGSARAKVNSDIESNYVLPGSDGTITVTHQIPTEVTIPVVNGKVTEYKNIITAHLSTEILGPKQYSTTKNPFGKEITVLLTDSTGFAANGAKQVTKYTLNESPTTAVIFTPTYIRGRKTSYSHIIPSTVYYVEPVVSTITPALPQAPLANILLSQLLLANPIQQQNAILGLQNPGPLQGTPTTEYKTRTTTYVTTVTTETSTVIPLTFHGKEILTTIIDSNTNVVTATEFITDTVVVTPTAVIQQNNQLNSLLVPLLLQQQQQQNINPLFQQPAGVLNTNEDIFKKSLFQDQDKLNLAIDDSIEESDDYQSVDEVTEAPKRKSSRKKSKKPGLSPPIPERETSVVTLYVSGRTPGEFSTVLSTVIVGEENKRKREATYVPVQPSKVYDDLIISTLGYVDTYVMPAISDSIELENSEPNAPTQSLESYVGDVSKHIITDSELIYRVKPTKTSKKYIKSKYEKFAGQSKNSGNFLAL